MKKRVFVLAVFVFGLFASGASPSWVVQVMNNVRRATVLAGKAGPAGKAVYTLGKCTNALPDDEIRHLAKIAAAPNGVKEMNKILGTANFIGKYGDDVGRVILNDTYLRVAVTNGRMSQSMASDIMRSLGGTPGLTGVLSKINSSNVSLVKGHMRELKIALEAQRRGYTAVSLGQKFGDGIKKGDTDLDVLLRANSRNFAIESKAYSGIVPDTMVHADADSLLSFCKEIPGTIPVFCFEAQPSERTLRFLSEKGVNVLVGTAEEVITKLDFLSCLK